MRYLLITLLLFSCSAEKKVLADIEKVQRVRAATDALFPCINDTTITTEFIHDSSTLYYRDTLVEFMNDTTFVYYFDTIFLNKTIHKTNTVKDNREINKLQDSLTAIRLRESSFVGQILSKEKEVADQSKARKQWMTYTLLLAVIAALLLALLIKKTLP